ncbi:MAG: triphosphoribosyl-dephospho-CoA synthase [Methylophilaceae bacterium]
MIKELFKQACLDELQAIKPGNVHVFADGHDMTVENFILSANVAAEEIAEPKLSLGQRILASVEATHKAVNCNTNLGIILLCAPLIHAHRKQLEVVLKNTTVEDCDLCFRAIALANPAGLGKSEVHDVHQNPSCTLQEAMQEAAMRDLIASQYSNNFADIFSFGIPNYELSMARWDQAIWATTEVYLQFLAHYLDSHVLRKYGNDEAIKVQNEAKIHLNAFTQARNPKTYFGELLRWDADFKMRKINPGTCADLTVATLFAIKLRAYKGNN